MTILVVQLPDGVVEHMTDKPILGLVPSLVDARRYDSTSYAIETLVPMPCSPTTKLRSVHVVNESELFRLSGTLVLVPHVGATRFAAPWLLPISNFGPRRLCYSSISR